MISRTLNKLPFFWSPKLHGKQRVPNPVDLRVSRASHMRGEPVLVISGLVPPLTSLMFTTLAMTSSCATHEPPCLSCHDDRHTLPGPILPSGSPAMLQWADAMQEGPPATCTTPALDPITPNVGKDPQGISSAFSVGIDPGSAERWRRTSGDPEDIIARLKKTLPPVDYP